MGTSRGSSSPSPLREFPAWRRREIREELTTKYGLICQLCLANGQNKYVARILLNVQNHPRGWSVDHIVPVSRGGVNDVDNMWPAHRSCNSNRGNSAIEKRKRNALRYQSNSAR